MAGFDPHSAPAAERRPSAEALYSVTRSFGTINIAVILTRIGLRIAAALEIRLANRAARPQQQLHAAARTPLPRQPREPRTARPRSDARKTPPPLSSPFLQPRQSPASPAAARSAPSSPPTMALFAVLPPRINSSHPSRRIIPPGGARQHGPNQPQPGRADKGVGPYRLRSGYLNHAVMAANSYQRARTKTFQAWC